MRTTIYLGMSLDGFIARADNSLDFLDAPRGDGEEPAGDMGFAEFLATVDAIVMGRKTYEIMRSFGPEVYPYGETRLIVLSTTLAAVEPGLPGNVEIRRGQPREVLRRLADEGVAHVYLDGGAAVRPFLAEGLVDTLIITRVPVLIGAGIRLWGPLPTDVRLRLMETSTFPGGYARSRYDVVRPG